MSNQENGWSLTEDKLQIDKDYLTEIVESG